MVSPRRDRLRGEVHVDVTSLTPDDPSKRGRSSWPLVGIAVEVISPRGFGRIRLAQLADLSTSLTHFLQHVMEPGAVLVAPDGLRSAHLREVQAALPPVAPGAWPMECALPGPRRIAALLDRWLLGTHQGAVSDKHLDYYLDEYTFRFNRRTANARGLLFFRLLENAVEAKAAPYSTLIAVTP
jgi:hypothetical protein